MQVRPSLSLSLACARARALRAPLPLPHTHTHTYHVALHARSGLQRRLGLHVMRPAAIGHVGAAKVRDTNAALPTCVIHMSQVLFVERDAVLHPRRQVSFGPASPSFGVRVRVSVRPRGMCWTWTCVDVRGTCVGRGRTWGMGWFLRSRGIVSLSLPTNPVFDVVHNRKVSYGPNSGSAHV